MTSGDFPLSLEKIPEFFTSAPRTSIKVRMISISAYVRESLLQCFEY